MTRRFRAPFLPGEGERVQLDAEVSHHLLRVTLVPRGEAVILFDGLGAECDGRLVDSDGERAMVLATSAARQVSALAPRVMVMGLTRKPAWDLSLRLATELGMTELRPFVARRSIAQGDHLDRWERITSEAARQCGRADAPTLRPVAPLRAQLAGLVGHRLVLTPGANPTRPAAEDEALCLLLGPEGGLAPDELALAAEAGFVTASLGRWTLRADTAVAVALARYAPS